MSFKAIFKQKPEIIQSANARVNLIGEHTDYTGGYVMPLLLPYKTNIFWIKILKKIILYIQNIIMKTSNLIIFLNLKKIIG